MRNSNCCNESLIVKTNLCSKCLKEVKIGKLTVYDFKRDNVLGLPFNEEKLNLLNKSNNKNVYLKSFLMQCDASDLTNMEYFAKEFKKEIGVDDVEIILTRTFIIDYKKHSYKIKNIVDFSKEELTYLKTNKRLDLVVTARYTKEGTKVAHDEHVNNHLKSVNINILKSSILKLDMFKFLKLVNDPSTTVKTNSSIEKLHHYSNYDLVVKEHTDCGDGLIRLYLELVNVRPEERAAFIIEIEPAYLNSIFRIKPMAITTSYMPKDLIPTTYNMDIGCNMVKCSGKDNNLPIDVGDKIVFKNVYLLTHYFNYRADFLNPIYKNKYVVSEISTNNLRYKVTIIDSLGCNYDSILLTKNELWFIFGEYNGNIKIEKKSTNKKVEYEKNSILDKIDISLQNIYSHDYTPILKLFSYVKIIGDKVTYFKLFFNTSLNINIVEELTKDRDYKNRLYMVSAIFTRDKKFRLKLLYGNTTIETNYLTKEEIIEYFREVAVKDDSKDKRAQEIKNKTKDKDFDVSKLTPAKIDDVNLFSNGEHVTIKDSDFEACILNGVVRNPFGWENFKDTLSLRIINSTLNTSNTERTFVFSNNDRYCGFTIDADKAIGLVQKIHTVKDKPINKRPPKTRKPRIKKGETKNSL